MPLDGIAGPRGLAPAHDVATDHAIQPQGRLGARNVQLAEAQPRAEGILGRAWAAISQFVMAVRGLFGRAEPAPAQPRAPGAGRSAGADPATAPRQPDAGRALVLNQTGTLQGQAAQSFERQVLTHGKAQQPETRTDNGICEAAEKDWSRMTLIIGGQTVASDLGRSVELLDTLTGGDERMKMRLSQFLHQDSFAGMAGALERGELGNRDANGIPVKPATQYSKAMHVAAEEDGGFRLTFELAAKDIGMLHSLTGEELEVDPAQSHLAASFSLRIAPDGSAGLVAPMNYDIQFRSLE